MLKISHRGNILGRKQELENSPDYILQALANGFDCEIDVRYINGKYYLGHDFPVYEVSLEFLKNKQIWCHAKDGTTLRQLLKDKTHCFYDTSALNNYTLTSRNFIWHWDGVSMIYVMDEKGLIGICSDYVGFL